MKLMITQICVLFFFGLNAQSVEISLSSTESTCLDNGSITATTTLLNGATAASYDYTITKNGMTVATINNAGNTITRDALPGGNYEVSVTTNTGFSDSGIVTVISNYEVPQLTLNIQNPTCTSNIDGTITSNTVNGRQPFTYKLYRDYNLPSQTLIEQNATGVFNNLPTGDYTVILLDDCNNHVVQTGSLFYDYTPMTLSNPTVFFETCDDYGVKIQTLSDGVEPYEYRLTTNNGVVFDWQVNDLFTFPRTNTNYFPLTYDVRDACGEIATANLTLPDITIQEYTRVSDFNSCDAKLEFKLASYWRVGSTYDYVVTYNDGTNDIPVSSGTTTRDVFVDPAVPGREYTITYTNQCGDSWSASNTYYNVDAVRVEVSDGKCEIGESRVRVFFDNSSLTIFSNNGNVNVNKPTFNLTTYPTAYSGDSEIFVNTTASALYINYSNDGVFVPGYYEFNLEENNCPTGVTGSFTITESTAVTATIETTVIPSCGDNNRISVEATTSSYVSYDKFDLYASDGITKLVDGALDSGSNPSTATFYNLSPGTYVVKYRKCNYTGEENTVSQTVTVDGVPNPSFEDLAAINCDVQDNLSISITPEGFGPFQYQVSDGPNNGTTYPTGWQNDPVLGSYPLGTYTVQVKDACDNILTQMVTSSSAITPGIDLLDTECGTGTQVFRVSNPVPNATYTWSSTTGDSGSGTEISLPSGSPYSVTVSAQLGTCANGSRTLQYDGTCEARPFPVKWLSISAESNEDEVDIKWTTTNEENASHFVVEYSKNDGNWYEIETVKAYNNWGEENKYNSTHRDPSSGINLYRIKQIDFDGQYEYSRVVSAKISDKSNAKFIVNNPVFNILKLDMDSVYGLENIDIKIIGADGRLSKTVHTNLVEENEFNINVQDFPSGLYMLIVKHNNIILTSSKFIKS